MHLKPFLLSALHSATSGGRRYHLWMGSLTLIILAGAYAYSVQLRYGLGVTGMSDHVSWGLYISNFTFLVGLAAAALMLVLPAYILEDVDFGHAVLMAEAVAVAALVMCLSFVVVDIGNPLGAWHLIPGIGFLNWPRSLLAWDVIVLNGYLTLNLIIPFYILYSHYTGRTPDKRKYLPWMYIAVMWAVSIHLVTAFLLAGLPARPFWNDALLGPRFLASAFTAGPAFVIVLLWFIRRETKYEIADGAFTKLALITTVAAQINLVMLISELFYKFYWPTHHGINARYLFLGLGEHNALVPWIWTAIAAQCPGDGRPDDPPAAAQPALADAGLRRSVRRHLDREGHRAGDPGLHSLAPWRNRRVHADLGRAVRDRRCVGAWSLRPDRPGAGGASDRAGRGAEPLSGRTARHAGRPPARHPHAVRGGPARPQTVMRPLVEAG